MTSLYRSFCVSMLMLCFFSVTNAQNTTAYWNDIPSANIESNGRRVTIPEVYRSLTLNIADIQNVLKTAPSEKNVQAKYSNVIISLPYPDGTYKRFSMVESPVMEQGLADQFPEIKTYAGQGIDDRSSNVRIDISPSNGFHAMIYAEENVYIDPYAMFDNYHYISYYKKDLKPKENFICELIQNENYKTTIDQGRFEVKSEGQLRTYRVVIAATGEYSAYYGGTVPQALAGIVTSLNRVDGVYENEFSVRMILVANDNLVIYTNSSTDPYTNNNGSTMLGQNQTTCDNVIGSANYDIGHVFSTGGGGVAFLGCVCQSGNKAKGVTGSGAPVGDAFDIDYVAHEMGHQFGGNHSFNSVTSNCGGGNRAANAAYEPGSASTIMGYAGICGADNLQPHSDPYFHTKNLDEIIAYTSTGAGNNCPVVTVTGNHNPVVTVPAGGFSIPLSTPFSLTGSATDADADPLKYCWEEYDLGPAGTVNAPTGNAPIFRSFNPVTTGTRIFPKVSDLVNNVHTNGELLPTYARSLSFRLTARDNKVGGGGVASSLISFNVVAAAGPFLVTSPNTAVIWNSPYPQTVTWNVAGTDASPVSCSNVNILLSTDGGLTFPITLISNTPNDGTESVNLPNQNTTTARIKVESVGNIFFDISNANFTISTATGIGNSNEAPLTFKLSQNFPNPFNPSTMISFTIPKMGNVSLNVYDIQGRIVSSLISGLLMTEGNYSYQFDGSSLSSGMYFYKLETGQFTETKRMILMK
ncbi:zinc-dependent metalloprotease family protein [soil metagenome]